MYTVTEEDKQVAIEMWESIRDDWLQNPAMSISKYKFMYLKKVGWEYKWSNKCLLCEYYAYKEDGSVYLHAPCIQCPLHNCAEIGSAYYYVVHVELPLQDRREACNKIIEAIKHLEVRG